MSALRPMKHGAGHHEGTEDKEWAKDTWIWISEGLGTSPSSVINHVIVGQSLYSFFICFIRQ